MSNINREKLLESMEIEQRKAMRWRHECEAWNRNSDETKAAEQSLLAWSKAILLVKGMESELSCEDCQRLGGVM